MAAWRAMNAVSPEAELMGGIGIAALAVNVTAALVLARFREGGDAQARAIWLFSRNDAINNVAVIIAAGLAYWLNRSEEHTYELQSLMRISYAVFCLTKK